MGNLVKALLVLVLTVCGAWAPKLLGLSGIWANAVGAALGALLALVPGLWLADMIDRRRITIRLGGLSALGLLWGGAGLLFGLVVSALGLLLLRQIAGHAYPAWELTGTILVVAGAAWMTAKRREELAGALKSAGVMPERSMPRTASRVACKVLDTSAIIDGRIADICQSGFLEGTLLVPGFVLAELQRIADSSDTLKRNRGRRGLDILNRMQKDASVTVKVYDRDFEDLTEVDTKIVRLARMLEAKVVTNDFNLNKVAELYGVPVLNINELSNAIKPIVLPGEEMCVHILKDGKEFGQGIGYLEDGTMVVVDGGRQHIGEDLEVLVTSVLQTAAGRMIFGKPKEAPLKQHVAVAQNL
ncbi:MAG: PIN/TRAM domain-containing protein [Patescibacteria group bacterium]